MTAHAPTPPLPGGFSDGMPRSSEDLARVRGIAAQVYTAFTLRPAMYDQRVWVAPPPRNRDFERGLFVIEPGAIVPRGTRLGIAAMTCLVSGYRVYADGHKPYTTHTEHPGLRLDIASVAECELGLGFADSIALLWDTDNHGCMLRLMRLRDHGTLTPPGTPTPGHTQGGTTA